MLFSALVLLLVTLVAHVSPQSNVTVWMGDPQISATYAGAPVSLVASGLITSSFCNSYAYLKGQTVSLLFNGTAITLNYVLSDEGGPAQLIVDGSSQTFSNYANDPVGDCTMSSTTVSNLAPGLHNVTVVTQPSTYMDLQNFVYTSSPPVTSSSATSRSMTPTPTTAPIPTETISLPTKAASNPSSGGSSKAGLIAAIVVVAVIIFLLILFRKRIAAFLAGTPTRLPPQPVSPQKPQFPRHSFDESVTEMEPLQPPARPEHLSPRNTLTH